MTSKVCACCMLWLVNELQPQSKPVWLSALGSAKPLLRHLAERKLIARQFSTIRPKIPLYRSSFKHCLSCLPINPSTPKTTTMAPSKTATVKNKHAGKRASNGSGISQSRYSTRPMNDGIVKKKAPPKTAKGTNKPRVKKKRVYTEKELNIPQLNMITPVGVEKPKMGKKGKVFVDDKVCWC